MYIRGIALAAITSSVLAFGASSTSKPQYDAERAERAKELTRPYGWMSLVALKGLGPGLTTVGSANDSSLVLPDAPLHLVQFEEKGGKVFLRAADSSLQLHGKSLTPGAEVSQDEDEGSALVSGSLRLWVIKRGDQRLLRVKDSDAPALKQFHGLNWYAPDNHYRVSARWVVDVPPHTLVVTNKLGQRSENSVPGHVEFALDGKRQTLVPLEADRDQLWFVFRDATYRKDTDQGGRFLTVKAPAGGIDHNADLVLDFNEAINPPCAYSPYATCPLASKENRLAVAIPAGEKRYEP